MRSDCHDFNSSSDDPIFQDSDIVNFIDCYNLTLRIQPNPRPPSLKGQGERSETPLSVSGRGFA